MNTYNVTVNIGKRKFSSTISAESKEEARKTTLDYWYGQNNITVDEIEIYDTHNFDYHCNWCDHEFFVEEGYEMEIDDIVCPYCGCKRQHNDYFITERNYKSWQQ